MDIFRFDELTAYLGAWIKARPSNGHGEQSRMAKTLGLSSTMMSQILSGDKALSLEHAVGLSEHLSLNELETDYLFILVELSRASHHKLLQRLKRKQLQAKDEANKIKNRVQADRELTSETKSVYYSSWTYTGIRNLTAIDGFHDVDSIALKLALSRSTVSRIVDFLLHHGLCKVERGQLVYGAQWTHIGNDSTLVVKHHHNWRLRGMTKMEDPSEEKLFFTAPMSMSHEVAREIRNLLPSVVEQIQKSVRPSASETVRCLNIDWFEY